MSETTSTTTSDSTAPYLTVETLRGAANTLELLLGRPANINLSLTQNALHNVQATLQPSAHPTIGYFGIGVGGSQYGGTGKKMVPNGLQSTNLGLYTQIPFRVVQVDQDLDATEMAKYAIRAQIEVDNVPYIAYYLKRITDNSTEVSLVQTDPTTGSETSITLDSSELTPTPPVITSTGSTTSVTSQASAQFSVTLSITGQEVLEAIDVLYNGDMSMASIDEIGIFTGNDQTVQVQTASGGTLSYLEAIGAELFQHRTSLGIPFLTSASDADIVYNLTSGNMCIVQNGQ